jgi:hypothetical protein
MNINEEIYKEISTKTNIHADRVESACRSMFEFISDTMEQGELKAVRLPYFVLVWCKPNRIKKLKERGIIK